MYANILIPTDGSEGTDRALEHAIDLAKRYDATLHTVYVVDTNLGLGSEAGVAEVFDALEAAGEQALEDVVERATAEGVETVEGSIARGTPHRAILDYVDEHGVDLVVMGTHGRTGLDRYLLGSVTEKVVRLSPVPVLTVGLDEETDEAE